MFSISGPGWSQPSQPLRRAPQRQQTQQVEVDTPRAAPAPPQSLLHPGTAQEFRTPLEAVFRRLPPALLNAFVEQGYVGHVIDSSGLHPLTLEVTDFDLTPFFQPAGDLTGLIVESALHDGGAATQEELQEWLELVQFLNPDLNSDAPGDTQLWLPAFGYWHGRRLPVECLECLRDPQRLLGAEGASGSVAGLVLHGEFPGIPGAANRLLFWEYPFRQQDPLLDWYILHELGHLTDYTLAFRYPDYWRNWEQQLEQVFSSITPPTRYAGTDPHELFAEAFAIWATPERPTGAVNLGSELARQRWALDARLLDPQLEELIEQAVQPLL